MVTFECNILGPIELTEERKKHIIERHPELKSHINKFSQVLYHPDYVRKSKIDLEVLLFYKYFVSIKNGKYLTIAVKKDVRNFVLTAYLTDKIRAGEKYEKE